MGMRLSNCSACGAVRGKPSRIKEESGLSHVCGFGKDLTIEGTSNISAMLKCDSSL